MVSTFLLVHITLVALTSALSMAMFTLYERKILGLCQQRTSALLAGWWGMLQPFSDALKLLTKSPILIIRSNNMLMVLTPMFAWLCSMMIWTSIPWPSNILSTEGSMLLLFIITISTIYIHMGIGWSSNSNYAMLGSMRSLASGISYEVTMAFLFMCICALYWKISLMGIAAPQVDIGPCFFTAWPILIMWLLTSLAETGRSPFDLAEGESELVSGFNVEYGGLGFMVLFMAEYMSILAMSGLVGALFSGWPSSPMWGGLMTTTTLYIFIWTRASMSRMRYDKLMFLCWLLVLPVSLVLLGGLWLG